jgi:hypothetical protein
MELDRTTFAHWFSIPRASRSPVPKADPNAPRFSIHRSHRGKVLAEADTEERAIQLAAAMDAGYVRDRHAPLNQRWLELDEGRLFRPV